MSSTYAIRALTRKDIPEVVKLQRKSRPMFLPWTPGQLESHIRNFPEGQWVVEDVEGNFVGIASTLIVDCPPEDFASWMSITGNGYFHTHGRSGDTLYVADISVDPDADAIGVRTVFYEAFIQMVADCGLTRILAGGRIPGYAEVASSMGPDQYVAKVVAGKAKDPILTFQLDYGFSVLGLMADHQNLEREARNFATLIEWRARPVAVKEIA